MKSKKHSKVNIKEYLPIFRLVSINEKVNWFISRVSSSHKILDIIKVNKNNFKFDLNQTYRQ